MKNTSMNPRQRRFLTSRPCLFTLLAGLLFSATAWQAEAQSGTYVLSNVWNIAAGTFNLTGGTDGGNRGLVYNAVSNVVFVPYRAGSGSYGIYGYDGATGAQVGPSTGAVGSGGLNCDQAGVGDDGTLYGCPLNTGISGSSSFKVYSWTNWANNSAYLCYASSSSDAVGTYLAGKRVGDTMAVTGSGTNTLILATAGGNNAWALLSTTDGINFTSTVLTNTSSIVTSGQNVFGLCFYTNNTFLVLPQNKSVAYLVQFPANFASLPSPVTTTLLGTVPIGDGTSAAGFISYSPAGQMLGMMTNHSTSPSGVFIFNTANILTSDPNLAANSFASPNGNGNLTGGVALGGTGKTNWLYAMDSNNGLHAYQILYTTAPIAPAISQQPVGVSNGAFAPQTLTVSATGTAPLAYAWEVNTTNSTVGATPIAGATNSSLTLASAVTNYYFVVVTNSAGSVTSSVVFVSTIASTTNSVVTPILSIKTGTTNYPWLANDDNTRGMAYDPTTQRLVVANKSSGATLYLLDANTGASLGTLNTSGINQSGTFTFPVDQVVVASDGAVYSGTLALTTSGQSFILTSWSSATTNATPYTAYSGDPGNGSGERWGDTMTVRGSGANTQILLGSRSGTNVALLTTYDGVNFSSTVIPVPGVPAGFSGLGVAFGAGNTFYAKNYLGDLFEVSFDPTGSNPSAVLLDYKAGSQFPSHDVGLGVDTVNNILGSVSLTDQNPDLQLYQLTGSSNSPVLFDQAFFANYNPNANGNQLAVVDMKYPRVYAMDVDIGIVGMTYGVPASTPPSVSTQPVGGTIYASSVPFTMSVGVSGTLPLYYQWQKNSVSNLATATNIPGATGASLTFNSPTTNATGWYDVIVTNFGGSVTSTPVLLTVVQPLTSPVVTNLWTVPAGSRPYLDGTTYGSRGLAYDTNTQTILICDSANTSINVLNAADGSDDSANITINTAGLPAGTFTLDQIGVADDGVLYGANLVLPGDGHTFSITSWSSISSGANENAAYSGDPGNGSGDRWGDTMAVRGAGVNTQILLGSYSGTNVALLTTQDGITFSALTIPVAGVPGGFAGLGVAFGAGNTFWAKGGDGYNLRQVAFDPTGTTPATVLETYTAGTQVPNTLTGLAVDATNNILVGTCFNDTPNDLQMYLLTGTTNAPVLFNQAFYGANNVNSQRNAAAVVKFPYAFGLDVNNGLVALEYGVPPGLIMPYNLSATYKAGTGLVLTWPSVSNRSYQLQSRASLSSGSWSNVGSAINGTGSTLSYTNNSVSGPALFYRVVGQ